MKVTTDIDSRTARLEMLKITVNGPTLDEERSNFACATKKNIVVLQGGFI